MIHEREPITNTFVSAPADMGQLNCAAYVAGIISGILNGASFVRFGAAYCLVVTTCDACRRRRRRPTRLNLSCTQTPHT